LQVEQCVEGTGTATAAACVRQHAAADADQPAELDALGYVALATPDPCVSMKVA
jgi:hypothetical protein